MDMGDQRIATLEKEFVQAYDSYNDPIFRFIFFRVHDREIAIELMQEVFVRTWDYTREGQEIQHMRGFLYQVARRIVIDYSRKKRDYSLESIQEKGFDPASTASNDIVLNAEMSFIVDMIHDIEEPYQTVLFMRYIDGLPPRDIAVILDESVNVISVRIHRGVKKLKNMVKREPAEHFKRTYV